MKGHCPMEVVGTKVTAADVENGVALDFTTTGDVAELRSRVATRAAVHDQMPCSGNAAPRGGGLGRNQPPASSVTESEIDRGARLVFTPKEPGELARLREFVHHRAETMQAGTCPCRRAP
jgi:hypothetical protein